MKMVASSKLHHAQVAIQNMLPYENMLEHILKSFLVSTPNVEHELQVEHKVIKRVALVVYSSNSSLCGGFNSNVIKMMMQAVDEYKAQGIDDITVYPEGWGGDEKGELCHDEPASEALVHKHLRPWVAERGVLFL